MDLQDVKKEWDKYRKLKARHYLSVVRRARNQLKTFTDEVIELKENVSIIKSAAPDGMPHNPNPSDDALLNAICAYEARCEKLNALCKEYNRIVLEADRVIASLNSHDVAAIAIYEHFLRDKSWYELEKITGYSYSHLTNDILNDALIELYGKMPHRFRDQIPRADG